MDYNALAVCQKPNEKPFVVSIYTYFDKDVVISNLERFKRKYKDTEIKVLSTWIEKREIIDYKELFYKRICENYIKTMDTQVLFQNPQNNNSIIHAYIGDEAIDLKYKKKINLQNYKEYLNDEESVYEYDTYEDFYEAFVKDFILEDIRDLGLFNGEKNEWDFYISYNDMILLGMEDEINKSIIEEIAENLKKENDEEQEQ